MRRDGNLLIKWGEEMRSLRASNARKSALLKIAVPGFLVSFTLLMLTATMGLKLPESTHAADQVLGKFVESASTGTVDLVKADAVQPAKLDPDTILQREAVFKRQQHLTRLAELKRARQDSIREAQKQRRLAELEKAKQDSMDVRRLAETSAQLEAERLARLAAERREQQRIARILDAVKTAEHFRVRIGSAGSFKNKNNIGYLEERDDGGVYLDGYRNYFKKLQKALGKADFMEGKGYTVAVYAVNGDEWIKVTP